MALSKDDRISLSKKIVQIPFENKKLDESLVAISANKDRLFKQDNANKSLQLRIDTVLNAYQTESEKLDGFVKEVLTESDIVNSVKRIKGNFLFPNDFNIPTPFLADGIWKSMTPYTKNKLLGKRYNETNSITPDNETSFVSEFQSKYNSLQSIAIHRRITGQECVSVSSPPPSTDPATETISPDPLTQLIMAELVAIVNKWIQIMDDYQLIIPTDYDASRNSEGIIAKNQAIPFKGLLQNWINVASFYTTHGQITCVGLESINESNSPFQTKFSPTTLNLLKTNIDNRIPHLTTRKAQVSGYLGTIDQTIDGVINSKSGLYGDRNSIIDLRVNAMGGSLSGYINSDLGIGAVNQNKSLNINAADVYSLSIKTTMLKIPASNTGSIHVVDSSGFNVGDTVYVYSEQQEELTGTVLEKNGTFIKLNIDIPQKYTPASFARIYKEL